MKKELFQLLKDMNFTHLTGDLWKHDHYGILSFHNTEAPSAIAMTIWKAGKMAKEKEIKDALNIKG